MAKFPPAFQFYAADFLTATDEWTVSEKGVYICLLASQWIKGDLPKQPGRLAKIVGCDVGEFELLWPVVKGKFCEIENGRLINNRLEQIRQQQVEYREKQSESGKKGAEKRWGSDNKGCGDPNGDPINNPNGQNIALQSSSSSSISSPKIDSSYEESGKPDILKEKDSEHFSEKVGDYFESIKEACDRIMALNPKTGTNKFNPYQWVQRTVGKKGHHPGALLDSLKNVHKLWDTIDNPWPYINAAFKSSNQNYNEQDAIAIHEHLKKTEAAELFNLTRGMLKTIGNNEYDRDPV